MWDDRRAARLDPNDTTPTGIRNPLAIGLRVVSFSPDYRIVDWRRASGPGDSRLLRARAISIPPAKNSSSSFRVGIEIAVAGGVVLVPDVSNL